MKVFFKPAIDRKPNELEGSQTTKQSKHKKATAKRKRKKKHLHVSPPAPPRTRSYHKPTTRNWPKQDSNPRPSTQTTNNKTTQPNKTTMKFVMTKRSTTNNNNNDNQQTSKQHCACLHEPFSTIGSAMNRQRNALLFARYLQPNWPKMSECGVHESWKFAGNLSFSADS